MDTVETTLNKYKLIKRTFRERSTWDTYARYIIYIYSWAAQQMMPEYKWWVPAFTWIDFATKEDALVYIEKIRQPLPEDEIIQEFEM